MSADKIVPKLINNTVSSYGCINLDVDSWPSQLNMPNGEKTKQGLLQDC